MTLYDLLVLIFSICIGIGQATPPFDSLSGYLYKPEFCGDTVSGRELYVGEIFTRPGQCVRVQCLGTLQLWEDSCKIPTGLKGTCTALPPTETNLEYPKCCPLYECKTYRSHADGELEESNTYDHNGNLRKSHVTEVIVIANGHRSGSANLPTPPVRKYHIANINRQS